VAGRDLREGGSGGWEGRDLLYYLSLLVGYRAGFRKVFGEGGGGCFEEVAGSLNGFDDGVEGGGYDI